MEKIELLLLEKCRETSGESYRGSSCWREEIGDDATAIPQYQSMIFYKEYYRILMQNIDMCILRPITLSDVSQIGDPIIFGTFSLSSPSFQPGFIAGLSSKYLLCFRDFNSSTPTHIYPLDFDLKFEVIRETPWKDKETPGVPIGIRFEKQRLDHQFDTLELYSDNPKQVDQWRMHLEKNINQRNFHALFKAKKKIGKGAFATVYLAERYLDKKIVAVKAFSKEKQYSGQKGRQSLINEISLLRKFDNPHILKLEGVYETDNSIYVIMEILEGKQLEQRLKKNQMKDPAQIKQITWNLLSGLRELAQKRVIHRDLKPENIIFRKQGSCDLVICDFGLATDADADKYLFVRCGTPGFVAPQIINIKDMSAKSDPISDVFSAGLIFHCLLLGRSIFDGRKYAEILSQNRACSFDFQRQMYERVDFQAMDLMKKLLEKNPRNRITAEQALEHPYFSMQEEIPEVEEGEKMIDENEQKITQYTSIRHQPRFSSGLQSEKIPSLHNKKISFRVGLNSRDKQNSKTPPLFSKKPSITSPQQPGLRRSKRNSAYEKKVQYSHFR